MKLNQPPIDRNENELGTCSILHCLRRTGPPHGAESGWFLRELPRAVRRSSRTLRRRKESVQCDDCLNSSELATELLSAVGLSSLIDGLELVVTCPASSS